jgi:hypothetical protein
MTSAEFARFIDPPSYQEIEASIKQITEEFRWVSAHGVRFKVVEKNERNILVAVLKTGREIQIGCF